MSSTTLPSDATGITPLLKQLEDPSTHGKASAEEIASGFALIFEEDRLNPESVKKFLTLLHDSSRDKDADVIAACAARMRDAAYHVDTKPLKHIIQHGQRSQGSYHGGLCDIVGTGGSKIQTYNISTTASLIASSFLLMSKHGNKAQTSVSGAADILSHISPQPPNLAASNAQNIPLIYECSSYAFMYAPNFHPGMKFAAPIRKALPHRTIFNLLGPLAHPIEELVEARLVGVANNALGPVFAEAIRLSSIQKPPELRKAMVVAGREGLDEISCAGITDCWMVRDSLTHTEMAGEQIECFELQPSDFGFGVHSLEAIRGGSPADNAQILMRLLAGELREDDPILQVVLMNAAAMLVVSAICESETSRMGEGDDGVVIKERGPGKGRWKEGVRRARWAVESGAALKSLKVFTHISNKLASNEEEEKT